MKNKFNFAVFTYTCCDSFRYFVHACVIFLTIFFRFSRIRVWVTYRDLLKLEIIFLRRTQHVGFVTPVRIHITHRLQNIIIITFCARLPIVNIYYTTEWLVETISILPRGGIDKFTRYIRLCVLRDDFERMNNARKKRTNKPVIMREKHTRFLWLLVPWVTRFIILNYNKKSYTDCCSVRLSCVCLHSLDEHTCFWYTEYKPPPKWKTENRIIFVCFIFYFIT